ncbi:hypothetical protein TSUD_77680 [Trifolium subterraneum]|uniref:Protein kinase domain-containing protein n=1 Tax=Trifolium subterraneum TaxID=3900 RepID=A0A2Z6NU66_TRISU|nr:hypothetical protein TSUD_77680 [Trifolium subterraneum]
MGCALGKPAGAGARHRRRDNTVTSEGGNNAVKVEERKEAEASSTGEVSGNVPATVSRLPRINSLAATQPSWPPWLMEVAGDAIRDLTPRRANTFEKLAKIGKGTYSNVYKAKDLITGKIVALKKVRIDNMEAESVKFMAREILVLRKLDHPNVIKLEGLVTSRISSSLYLVFEYMEHDLAGLIAGIGVKFSEPQVEQLHKIYKLCGSPSDEYWKKYKLPNATLFKPQHPYRRRILETFADFPSSSLPLIETLLAIDPDVRGTSSSAINSEFFTTEPYACEPSSLPKYPPTKELDVKLRDEARRQRALNGKTNAVDGVEQVRARERSYAIPAPEANAEIQTNLDRLRVVTQADGKSKSEKFPPPHEDGAVGYLGEASNKGAASFGTTKTNSFSSILSNSVHSKSVGSFAARSYKGWRSGEADSKLSSWKFMRSFKPSTVGLSFNLLFGSRR